MSAPRAMCVLEPLKVIIENLPAETCETIRVADFPKVGRSEAHRSFCGRLLTNSPPSPLNPQEPARGSHEITLTREIYIERNDFRKEPTKGYYGLVPGKEVTRRPPLVLCTTHPRVTCLARPGSSTWATFCARALR